MVKPQAVTDATFEQEVTGARGAVLVDFGAEWCPPCRALAPVLEEIAREQGDRLRIVKLDIDENERTTIAYDVMSFPTLILFKDGEPVKRIVGARPKGALMRELGPFLHG
jgi:thioredoxin 1